MALITYDEYLEHHGVKGMRWGVRRQATKLSQKLANRTAKGHTGIEVVGRHKIKASGGSRNVALAKTAGRTAAVNVLTNVGANLAVKALHNNPSAAAAISVGASLVKTVNLGVGVRDTVGIAKAGNSQKNK